MGRAGAGAYDCSGLTSQAWGQAGTPVPRTSEEQWARLKRIPLKELRPGDLVIYFPEATHVAMYLGQGMVVQAPRTGEKVKVSPLASNPVLGAVRPDPGGVPLCAAVPAAEAPARGGRGGSGAGSSGSGQRGQVGGRLLGLVEEVLEVGRVVEGVGEAVGDRLAAARPRRSGRARAPAAGPAWRSSTW